MRKFLFATALLPLLLLASCAGGSKLTPEEVNSIAQQVRDACARACSYQPDLASVTALISGFYKPAEPFVALINAISTAVCQSPTTLTTRRGGVLRTTRIVVTPTGKTIKVTGTPVQ